MTLKEIIGRGMEYTPFVGLIPGITRIYIALDPNIERDSKINKFAMNYLGIDSQSSNYSAKGEIWRGIVSCIPGVNLVLIPKDIINAIFPCKKILTPRENLEKAKESLIVLHEWYKTSKALKEMGKKCDLCEFYTCSQNRHIEGVRERTEDHKILREEIIEAFRSSLLYIQNSGRFSKQNEHTKFNETSPFDPWTFSSCLERMLSASENTLMRHAFYFIDVTADVHASIATAYVRKYHQEMLDEVERQLEQFS